MRRVLPSIIGGIIAYLLIGKLCGLILPHIYAYTPQWIVKVISAVFEPVFVVLFGTW